MLCLQSLSLYREEAGWMDSSEKTADFDLLISHFLPTVNVSFFFHHDDEGYPNQVDFVPKPSPILSMIIWICHSFVRHWQTMLLVQRNESFKLLLINIFGLTVILTIVEFNYYCNKYFWYGYLQSSLINELQWAILIKQTIVEMSWYAVLMDSHLEYFSWKWSITINQLLYKWCYNYLQPLLFHL